MACELDNNSRYRRARQAWEQRTPRWRRIAVRVGLQGKLVLCFMTLLAVALGGASWMYLKQSTTQVNGMIGEQARTLASALALGSTSAMSEGDPAVLRQMGQDLLRSRNILFVGFLDAGGKPIVLSSRDPDFGQADLAGSVGMTLTLMQVQEHKSPLFGRYLEVVAPIITVAPTQVHGQDVPVGGAGTRLLGYVSVGMSQDHEQAVLRRTTAFVIAIGAVIAFFSLPMAYLLVHRIFYPIRQLVDATRRIAAGDLNHRVAIDRPDVIGMLARAFNEMVNKVKSQQDDLAAANAQLAEANRGLEEKVQQRTSQLEAANKRLSVEIAEKEDFLRAVSHDLNAPLRNIAGMATMLLMKHRERFDEDVIHRLERIQKNVQVETDLISELLELSRIKTRRQRMEPVDVGALVRELFDVFDNDLRTRGIHATLETPLPVLNCERARLRQVFQNLIDNAIKYMGDRPTRDIRVGCRIGVTEAEFYVSDTGMGIEPEDIDKVFYVFRRGKNSATQSVAGKGVGLASVKSIIETYSGSIWVESRPNEGSTFRFTINGRYLVGPHPMDPAANASVARGAEPEQGMA